MNISRLVLAVFSIVVAGVFYVDALDYPAAAANMPLIYSVAVALLGVAMIVQEVVGARRRATSCHDTAASNCHKLSDSQQEQEDPTPRHWKVALVFVLAAAYVYSIGWLGYVLATAMFMTLALSVVRHAGLRFSVIGVLLLIVMICLVFIAFLGLPVPLWPPVLH